MQPLYNAHPETFAYLAGHDTVAFENPMYNPETHDEADQYLYNPRTSSLHPPPVAGENEVAVLADGQWVLRPDYREKQYWDIATKQGHKISEIGVEPDPGWTDLEPGLIQVWDGVGWTDDHDLWLDQVVRPGRDIKLAETDKYMLSDYPITETQRGQWVAYRQALRDLPETLETIVDPIPWPAGPVQE